MSWLEPLSRTNCSRSSSPCDQATLDMSNGEKSSWTFQTAMKIGWPNRKEVLISTKNTQREEDIAESWGRIQWNKYTD